MPTLERNLNGNGLRIGIVMSRFNEPIVRKSLQACLERLHERGVSADEIDVATVPGALEIPLLLQSMAQQTRGLGTRGKYDALIALGAVIRGETYHFELVANESARGIMDVSLNTGVPVSNGVLTTDNDAQAEARAPVKGAECADVAVEMARLISEVMT